jgi:mRNA interferase RelE/StbE
LTCQVLLHPKAAEFLGKCSLNLRSRIKEHLRELENDPEEKGTRLKYSRFWRLRIGNYRVIYEIDREKRRVYVLFVGHRRAVYDDFSRLF